MTNIERCRCKDCSLHKLCWKNINLEVGSYYSTPKMIGACIERNPERIYFCINCAVAQLPDKPIMLCKFHKEPIIDKIGCKICAYNYFEKTHEGIWEPLTS
jgi:nitrate reductase cytochrome c-type subunit